MVPPRLLVEAVAEVAGAGRQDHAADVFADDRALRRQAVVIAVLLVAERHAVHRVAELLAAEAVHEQRDVLLVVAPRVGGLEADAGQGFQRLQRVNAGQDLLHVGLGDGDRGAGLVRGHFDGGDRAVGGSLRAAAASAPHRRAGAAPAAGGRTTGTAISATAAATFCAMARTGKVSAAKTAEAAITLWAAGEPIGRAPPLGISSSFYFALICRIE